MLSQKIEHTRRALSSKLAAGEALDAQALSIITDNLCAWAREAEQLEAQTVPAQARHSGLEAAAGWPEHVVALTQHRRPRPRPVHTDNDGGAA